MTLQRFLESAGETWVAWAGRAGWRPAPTRRFGVDLWLAQSAVTAALSAVPGFVMAGLLVFYPVLRGGWWPVTWWMLIGAAIGLVGYGMIAVAWNRRAGELVKAGLSTPRPSPPTEWWQRWLVAPIYMAVCFGLTPVLLTVSVDNVVGHWQWQRERAARIARGEPLVWATLQGPAPSEAENFAMAPLVRAAWDYRVVVTNGRGEIVSNDPVNRARLELLSVPTTFKPPTDRSKGPEARDGRLKLDWVARSIRSTPMVRPDGLPDEMARRYGLVDKAPEKMGRDEILALKIDDPAGEVLEYLKRREPELNEIREASRRPRSRFSLKWEDDVSLLLPPLAKLKSLSLTYRISSVAKLAKADVTGAFEDVRVGFRLAETLSEEPVLISHLVQIAQYAIATAAAWEGMAEHRWNDGQLAELQERFARTDFQQALVRTLRGELAYGLSHYERWLGKDGNQQTAIQLPDGSDPGSSEQDMFPPLPFLAPRGVFRRNQIHHTRAFDRMIAQVQDPAWPTGVAEIHSDANANSRYMEQLGLLPRTPNNILPAMMMPAMWKIQTKAARMQTTARLGEVACGLERFRLRNGAYPERLDALVPTLLARIPNDPMNGQALEYRRTDDGWFVLWSVGPNGRDDGGEMKSERNDEEGDWVWPTPVPRVGLRLF